MKAFLQRTCSFTVIRSREDLSSDVLEENYIGVGMVVLLGWDRHDEERDDLDAAEDWILNKISKIRIFPDEEGKMNMDLPAYMGREKLEGGILWVPQFTLAGKMDSGYRPSFSKAMTPLEAKKRFEGFKAKVQAMDTLYTNIFGVFGADMEITFTNWGPVSLMIEK